jgi:hypothetical protein
MSVVVAHLLPPDHIPRAARMEVARIAEPVFWTLLQNVFLSAALP